MCRYPTCPRGQSMNKSEIPLLMREEHEREMSERSQHRHGCCDHAHGAHGNSHGNSHGTDDLEAGTVQHDRWEEAAGVGLASGSHAKRASSRERRRPHDAEANGAIPEGDTAAKAQLEQQLRDIGFDD